MMKQNMVRLKPELLASIRSDYKGCDVKGMALMLWDTDGTTIGAVLPSGTESFLNSGYNGNAYGEILCLATIDGLTGYLPLMCCDGGSGWLCQKCADKAWEQYLIDQQPVSVVCAP